jgi:hypothetical protein
MCSRLLAASVAVLALSLTGQTHGTKPTMHTNIRKPPLHGSWSAGPGNYTFGVCPYGTTCNLIASAGTSIPITFEVWSGGGGGGGGGNANSTAGNGGGGGGGGGYAKTTITVVVPNGVLPYVISVGAGGGGGAKVGSSSDRKGQPGGGSGIQLGSNPYLYATGGLGGEGGSPDILGAWGGGGVQGGGNYDSWNGTAGYHGGPHAICRGGAGGYGGAGGGPGRTGPGYVNDGGDGGHGGYLNQGLFSCNKESQNHLQGTGVPGGNGKVKITW